MTQDFWLRLALAVPIIIGIWTLFNPGMLLGWFGDILDDEFPDVVNKPLWKCPPCMASVHGTWIWFATNGTLDFWWPMFCLSLCGVLKVTAHNLLKDA